MSAVEKWIQPPDLSTNGIDIRMDRSDGFPRLLADDFLCTTTGAITGVQFWGSWNKDNIGKLNAIRLSIHEDIPATPVSHSRPGALLWEKRFLPGEFSMTLFHQLSDNEFEWWMDPYDSTVLNPLGDQQVWLVKVPIDESVAFIQKGSAVDPVVYWLDINVQTDQGHEFGWKTSDRHWNDDATFYVSQGTGTVSGW